MRTVLLALILASLSFGDEPLHAIEVDPRGNVLIPAEADFMVIRIEGEDIPEQLSAEVGARLGSRCLQSYRIAEKRTGKSFTLICLPREYNLYKRLGRGEED